MNRFKIQKPRDLTEAVGLLPAELGRGRARILAGGQDLLTELKENLDEPESLVSLGDIQGLRAIEARADGSLILGALTTLDELANSEQLKGAFGVLSEAAASVASPQIRHVATLGGNLNQRPRCWYFRNENAPCLKKGGATCFAESGRNKYNAILGGGPSYIVHPSDMAPALVSLGAEAVLSGPEGERRMPLEDYYTLPKDGNLESETVRKANEVLTHVVVPAPPMGTRSTYLKFKERASYDFALSSVALVLTLDGDMVTGGRLVLGGVAPRPWRAKRAELELRNKPLAGIEIEKLGDLALQGAAPLAENGYKVPLTKGLITRAIRHLQA